MNRDTIEAMRSTVALTDLTKLLDFRNIVGGRGMAVSWKGVTRGSVSTEKSDRNYTVAVRASGHSQTCDTLGEAVLYLVPELLEVPCTFVVKHFPGNPVGQRWAINGDAGTVAYAFCHEIASQLCNSMNADPAFQVWHSSN